MNFNKLIPELSVFDIRQTLAFYKQLGFEVIYERPQWVSIAIHNLTLSMPP